MVFEFISAGFVSGFLLVGGRTCPFMLGLIAFPSNAVVYAVSTGSKSMIKDFLQGQG
ncbi:hypothetical protein QM912_04285 [Streptococcus parasanguinis]|uniref:hypothetical protein n=1 Tax=Streptococcus parasanguinis TaxID=1318 RepID=UPI001CEDC525|nr:hypothetical protein [Streptococcus parasanguinis]